MKKILLMTIALLSLSCAPSRMEENTMTDCGKKEIGSGLYLKKIYLSNGDRVYLVVDEYDRLAGSSSSTSITISNGKSTRVESTSVITR